MDPVTTTLNIDPALLGSWIITALSLIIAYTQWQIAKDILEASRAFAIVVVTKSRITADGKITTEEKDEFIDETFKFLNKLEDIFRKYILNHPATGWIRGFFPAELTSHATGSEPVTKPKGA